MYNYKTLTKAQLIELMNEVENILSTSIQAANEAAKNYSTEMASQTAFEVGYLGGRIKTTLSLIEDYKKC